MNVLENKYQIEVIYLSLSILGYFIPLLHYSSEANFALLTQLHLSESCSY